MKDEPPIVNAVDQRWREQGWPDPEANAAFMSVIRAYHLLQKQMRLTLEPCDLRVIDYGALVSLALAPDGQLSLAELAKALLVAPTRLTYIVDRLERRGTLERRPHDHDRRSVVARITPEGRALVAAGTQAVATDNFGFGDMDAGALRALTRTMLGIEEVVRTEVAAAASEPPPSTGPAPLRARRSSTSRPNKTRR
jgi:DNA-binding MarR family transcriptional regulator